MSNIVIVSAKRSPIGKFMGSLSQFSAVELGKFSIDAVLNEIKLEKDCVDQVIFGQVLSGGCGQNPARQSSMMSGIPVERVL